MSQRILQIVDDALAAALAARSRGEAEAGAVKEAEAVLRSELAIGLRDLAEQIKSGEELLSYEDLGRMLT